jgi:nitrate reductase gamma subunit
MGTLRSAAIAIGSVFGIAFGIGGTAFTARRLLSRF